MFSSTSPLDDVIILLEKKRHFFFLIFYIEAAGRQWEWGLTPMGGHAPVVPLILTVVPLLPWDSIIIIIKRAVPQIEDVLYYYYFIIIIITC